MVMCGKKILVSHYLTRAERMKEMEKRVRLFTNVYIKNFGDKLDEEKLKEMFEVSVLNLLQGSNFKRKIIFLALTILLINDKRLMIRTRRTLR